MQEQLKASYVLASALFFASLGMFFWLIGADAASPLTYVMGAIAAITGFVYFMQTELKTRMRLPWWAWAIFAVGIPSFYGFLLSFASPFIPKIIGMVLVAVGLLLVLIALLCALVRPTRQNTH